MPIVWRRVFENEKKKEKPERKYGESKTSELESDYEIVTISILKNS